MRRRLMPWLVASVVTVVAAAAGWSVAPADPVPAGGASEDFIPMGDPKNEPDMDHGGKKHHHHGHTKDHNGHEHQPGGLGEHHHHHHAHPHPADPHHHHPH